MHESSLFISKPVSLWLEMKEREDVWHLVAPACGLPLGTLCWWSLASKRMVGLKTRMPVGTVGPDHQQMSSGPLGPEVTQAMVGGCLSRVETHQTPP